MSGLLGIAFAAGNPANCPCVPYSDPGVTQPAVFCDEDGDGCGVLYSWAGDGSPIGIAACPGIGWWDPQGWFLGQAYTNYTDPWACDCSHLTYTQQLLGQPGQSCESSGSCAGGCYWMFDDLPGGGVGWVLQMSDCGPGCGCACPAVTGSTFVGQTAYQPCADGTTPSSCGQGGPCDGQAGDTDGDGCCDSVDCYTNDPTRCTCDPGPCDSRGGDGDGDGCCADVDLDDSDPLVCSEPPPEQCSGTCNYVAVRSPEGEYSWEETANHCTGGAGCHCCPPPVKPTRVGETSSQSCTESACPVLCADQGGDRDGDGCCDDDDHDPDDPDVCDGRCDGWRERCERTYPGPDEEEGTEDDIVVECDPGGNTSPNLPPCICERIRNGDRDGDKCCDFDERSEEEADDPLLGCECCRISDEWKKSKGCLIEWEWTRIWGGGPRMVIESPSGSPAPLTRPTSCETACGGKVTYTATLGEGGTLFWSLGGSQSNSCAGVGCHACMPTEAALRVGQTVERQCQSIPCPDQNVIPGGGPDDSFTFTVPLGAFAGNPQIEDVVVSFPITLAGWQQWLQSASGSGASGAVLAAVDEYRQWFRAALTWVCGVMLAGVVLRELRV